MEVYPSALWRLLLASLLFGSGIGVLYDCIRIQRVLLGISRYTKAENVPVFCPSFLKMRKKRAGKGKKIAKFVCLVLQDILFCLSVGILLSILLFYRNDGVFRGFVLIGAAVGFAAYYFTVGRLVIGASEYIVFALRTAFLYLVYYVSLPFIALGRFLLARIGGAVKRIREKRQERVQKQYHAKVCHEMLALSSQGFLKNGWTENEKSTEK